MFTNFTRLAMVAALSGFVSLTACDEAENDPLGTPDGAGAARHEGDVVRPGDAAHGAGNGSANPAREGAGMEHPTGAGVDGHPGGVVDGAAGGAMHGEGGKAPDNTAHNKGDANDAATKTPFDQSNAQPDIKVTADIRKAILGMEGMSTNADNVKVITSADGVAIRGVVESQSEIDSITRIVQEHAGTRKVDIQLSVDPD